MNVKGYKRDKTTEKVILIPNKKANVREDNKKPKNNGK